LKLIPKSLFARLVLLLLSGLIVVQLLSAFILLRDRGQLLYRAILDNMINRTTGIVRLLDSVPAAKRAPLLPLLGGRELHVYISPQPLTSASMNSEAQAASDKVRQQLLQRLAAGSEVLVSVEGHLMSAPMRVMRRPPMDRHSPVSRPWAYTHGIHAMARFFHIQIRLQDGSWVHFEHGLSTQRFRWPVRLLLVLAILLVSVVLLSLLGVRLLIHPLRDLRQAAEGLGKDIQQAPLAESGPTEVRATAQAFNIMQTRLKNYIQDRSAILAAVSHDLKTPLTRLRLRTDLLDDEEVRKKMLADLTDMESMVNATLDFMRGSESKEPSQRLDLLALLESIQADAGEAGQIVRIHSQSLQPYLGRPLALKRCLVNLIENALRYGGEANIELSEAGQDVLIKICDKGPGIADELLDKVFDPFFRLETSRAKHSGGTGLGLGIARNIARAHGGDLTLKNKVEGGLCAYLHLPR